MKKVLILEHNARSLERLKCLVFEAAENIEVFALNRAADAYECVLTRTIDLFIVDAVLDADRTGDLSGLKFVDWLRKCGDYKFIPVIMIAALEDPMFYIFQELHCYSYLEKHFDPEKLKKIVGECLEFPGIPPQRNMLYLRKDGIIWTVDKDSIVFAKNRDRQIEIHIWKDECLRMPYMTLRQLTRCV